MSDDNIIESEIVSEEHEATTDLVLPGHALPERLLLLPVFQRPFFPAQVQPLMLDLGPWERTLELISKEEYDIIGLCFVDAEDSETPPSPDQFAEIGCAVRIHNIARDEGTVQLIAQGLQRFKIQRWLSNTPPYMVEAHYPQRPAESSDEIKAYAMALIRAIKELLPLNPLYNEELKNFLNNFSLNDPSPLADFAAAITTAEGRDLQAVLATFPLRRRMNKALLLLRKELEVAKLQHEISKEVNDKISEHQREFFLKEQLKVIQRELGISKDDRTLDVEQFMERMAQFNPPEHVQQRFEDELQKLSTLEVGSAEYGVTRSYLDWITSVPWQHYSTDKFNLPQARKVLDKHHDGLDDVKKRIIEFLAVGAFKGEVSGSILLLVGPPGVGKTSIGRSIAEAMGREFYRFSLGGMRDEAEIKGHRRTYIGAMPGKLVQALKEVKVSNPVIMLDEIDKIGSSYQGDPASALLEVLDPEQNSEFLDHYLDMRLDLSKALFVCTANQLDTIPGPLLDRMDTIRLAGYITSEKLAIAKHHLWPKVIKRAGLKRSQITITDVTIKQIIEGYAREAGVRNLEKHLSKLVRKAVVQLLDDESVKKIRINSKNLESFLGAPYFRNEKRLEGVGVVTGLAWTSLGGATLPVEASCVHAGNRGFKLTGKLGEVMKESAEIAYSYTAAHIEQFGGEPDWFDKRMLHLHVPEGATPKDGPSAGITMTTALISLATEQTINRPLAMTGEITLTGHVMPVGGIREKVIAARRIGLMELILPETNRRDFDELPEQIKEGITVHFAAIYQDVYRAVFQQ